MKKALLIIGLLCLPVSTKADTWSVVDGGIIYSVGDQRVIGPDGININVSAAWGGGYGLQFPEGERYISFYWEGVGATNIIGFYGPDNPNQMIDWYNGCDLSPSCGNSIDRQFTFDFGNFPGGVTIMQFRAMDPSQDFQVLNLTYSVPEPSTWALMLAGFAGIFVAFRKKTNDRWA